MFNWEMRELLAQHVEEKDAKMARKILRDQAEYFHEQAQQSLAYPDRYRLFDARTKRLLSATFEINNLLAVENSIERERAAIRVLDNKLVKAVETLRALIGECAAIAKVLHQAGLDVGQVQPIFQGRAQFTVYHYHTPLLYLESFGHYPTTALCGWRSGRPDTYETIETLGFCHWPFIPVALCEVWQRYLYESLDFYSMQLKFARGPHGSTEVLFEISNMLDEVTADPFDIKNISSAIELVKKYYIERATVRETIAESIAQVDHFYNSLSPCEKSMFIGELSSPFGNPGSSVEGIFRPVVVKNKSFGKSGSVVEMLER